MKVKTLSEIKIKERKHRTVKTINKSILWTERVKDPIVYLKDKSKDEIDEQETTLDYGINKIKFMANRAKDEILYSNKVGIGKIDNFIKNYIHRKRYIKVKQKVANSSVNVVNNSGKLIKNTEKVAQESIKKSKKILEKSRKVLKKSKTVVNTAVSIIKNMINNLKSLVSFLLGGGIIAVVIIVVICLIGLLYSSIYGVFFSSEDIGNNIRMNYCIQELNAEMDKRIKLIENNNPHDEVIITSNRASWKEILSVYAVRISNGKQEVVTIDESKKQILREIFWDMNTISYEVKIEKYEHSSIGSLDNNMNNNLYGENDNINKNVLHININSKDINYIKLKYKFSELEINQLNELLDSKNNNLWSSVIYGAYGSSGEITEWKQKGKEWSDIKIGNTNSTIRDIGCLVTSIAILIEKSGVSTNDIYPFNPGTFVIALNNNYGFDASGNLYYSAISKVVPDFIYQGHVNLRGKSKSEKFNEIKKYFDEGYYIVIEVGGATRNSQHWVTIDNISDDKILMLDPATYYVDMWDRYDWNNTTQFVYFKMTL